MKLATMAVALAVATAVAPSASANPAPHIDLTVPAPVPSTLMMRPAAARPAPTRVAAATPADKPGGSAAERDRYLELGSLARGARSARTLEDKVIFRFDLGFGLDGGQLNCNGEGNCASPPSGISSESFSTYYYSKLRAYAFGDAIIGSRGIVAPSLNTYFAASFRFDQNDLHSTAVPSIHDASQVDPVLVRAGYAETDGFFKQRLLEPIFVRAGRQWRYGPAIAHFDGITIGYDSRPVSIAIWGGTRVSLYGLSNDNFDNSGAISGADVRVDMYELKRAPLVLTDSMLTFDGKGHFEGGVALRWSREVVLRASTRISGNDFGSLRLSMRRRLSKVTTLSAEVESHQDSDWEYDLLLDNPRTTYDATDPRRYLDFGYQLPRLRFGVRFGTVLLDNIDLLARFAGSLDRKSGIAGATADAVRYLEGGTAIELRLRRTLALGGSVLTRIYGRDAPGPGDVSGGPNELASQIGAIGERSFTEGGLTARFEPAQKSFSATAELYGRLYNLRSPYIDPADRTELRSGGRFTVTGQVNDYLRMKLEYDTAFAPTHLAPEIRGMNSLRVLAEGTF